LRVIHSLAPQERATAERRSAFGKQGAVSMACAWPKAVPEEKVCKRESREDLGEINEHTGKRKAN